MKKVTVSLPNELHAKSVEYASQQGMNINDLIIQLLQKKIMTGSERLLSLFKKMDGIEVNTKSYKWNRNEIYDRKVFSKF